MRKKLKKLQLVRETVMDLGKLSGAGYTDPESGCWTIAGGWTCADLVTGHCGGNCTSRTSCDSDVCVVQGPAGG
jgi:hypothetical protein